MLVLTRKAGQNITIGDKIRVSVIDIRGRQVRLGVEAPQEWPIHREEVFLRIQAENQAAAAASPHDLTQALDLVFKRKGEDQA